MLLTRNAGLALASLSLLGLAASHPAQAQTYNAANDFSTTDNPNGVWRYGYEAGNAPFTLYQKGRKAPRFSAGDG